WGREEGRNKDDAPDCWLRFPGQYEDAESGLYYNRFRYYDPDTAQYISADPIGLLGGTNPYGYVLNPLREFDPFGLSGIRWDCKAKHWIDTETGQYANGPDLSKGPLANGVQVSGRFALENGPKNGVVFRANNNGSITSYAVYDSNGMIIKRVDITGAAHAGVSTPHVIEYGRNTLPNGTVRVQTPPTKAPPRPADPGELP
ncbi:TPA: hypothetical protein J1226_004559, partial [Escherichia coli]|nr:hypothetical protein [Escherichia coli]HBA8841380.1 hypothetical protein [Escherichia coli]